MRQNELFLEYIFYPQLKKKLQAVRYGKILASVRSHESIFSVWNTQLYQAKTPYFQKSDLTIFRCDERVRVTGTARGVGGAMSSTTLRKEREREKKDRK